MFDIAWLIAGLLIVVCCVCCLPVFIICDLFVCVVIEFLFLIYLGVVCDCLLCYLFLSRGFWI